jgi:U32 family peptidase
VKVYLTVNAVVLEREIKELSAYLEELKSIDIDAYIISDFAALEIIKKINDKSKIHISTQANVTNHLGVNYYASIGASRINISREISFEDLKKIIELSKAEIEVFAHGALCISYSGRCMLSKYMSGRDANKGQCAHSCRWKYHLLEESRPNLFYNITQDEKGTYIYNSRDLCLLEKLDKLVEAGVDSIKIEGRMKTENYVSQITWVYRKALEYIKEGLFSEDKKKYLIDEIAKTTHRNFTLGFMFLEDYRELEENNDVRYIKNYRFVGVVEKGMIRVKNQFKRGETIEILEPGSMPYEFKINEMKILKKGEFISSDVANPNDFIQANGLEKLDKYAILRIKSD